MQLSRFREYDQEIDMEWGNGPWGESFLFPLDSESEFFFGGVVCTDATV